MKKKKTISIMKLVEKEYKGLNIEDDVKRKSYHFLIKVEPMEEIR